MQDENERGEKLHWADKMAQTLIKKKPFKNLYVCASGITPSGTVHIGNFREIISTDLVVRALRELGKEVKFIYSWDDYDVFRKVPSNMPKRKVLRDYLRFPITAVPDTCSNPVSSYARKNELDIEDDLSFVGIHPTYIYQADRYKKSYYAKDISFALQHKEKIKEVLNRFRSTPLEDDWWPISVFSSFTGRDTTTILSFDGKWKVKYRDNETFDEEELDLRHTGLVKLNWRIDWPMRWAKESVDFEPAGKDHHSRGGSFDTSSEVVKIFNAEAPLSFQYDFISIKGRGGKISSSSGDVISLSDVLEIYTPEVTRFMFAKPRPNTEFAISFDTDVFKIYEDYDNTERTYFGITQAGEEKRKKDSRIYELSQVSKIPEEISYQISFRHLCNLLLINDCNVANTVNSLVDLKKSQRYRLKQKAVCAVNWLKKYASEDFKWSLSTSDTPFPQIDENEKRAVEDIANLGSEIDNCDEKALSTRLYDIAEKNGIDSKALFRAAYLVLIERENGPRLAGFLKSLGSERVFNIIFRK